MYLFRSKYFNVVYNFILQMVAKRREDFSKVDHVTKPGEQNYTQHRPWKFKSVYMNIFQLSDGALGQAYHLISE